DDSGPKKSGGPRINPDSFLFETVAEQDRAADARAVGDDAIRLVNRIIAAGLEREASDIHIEGTAQGFRVRFRANGMLQDWSEPIPATTSLKGVTARIKVLAGLDITERRLPQDGRIGVTSGKREIDLRVSTLPANRGEKIVLRILEAAGSTRALEQIFFDPAVLAAARKALNRPYGGIVIAGPTGSGKTSSLYALLNERKVTRPDTHIIIVEHPIAYRLPAVPQVQVNGAVGPGFGCADAGAAGGVDRPQDRGQGDANARASRGLRCLWRHRLRRARRGGGVDADQRPGPRGHRRRAFAGGGAERGAGDAGAGAL